MLVPSVLVFFPLSLVLSNILGIPTYMVIASVISHNMSGLWKGLFLRVSSALLSVMMKLCTLNLTRLPLWLNIKLSFTYLSLCQT
jgi:hypothetical protein